MKKLIFNPITLAVLLLVTTTFLLSSCSKSDDTEPERQRGKIEDAVGSYKGTLRIYEPYKVSEVYNAILEVSKSGTDALQVKAKAGETYSIITPKTFRVEVTDAFNTNPVDIVSLSGATQGLFHYDGVAKTISVITNKQNDTEIEFQFEGDKL